MPNPNKSKKPTIHGVPENGDLRVCWIPQLGSATFCVHVATVLEGVRLMSVLADYDLFQFKNRIKPDYANTGWLERYSATKLDDEAGPGWENWYSDDEEWDDPRQYLEHMRKINPKLGVHVIPKDLAPQTYTREVG